MSVYKSPKSPFYRYDFQISGHRFHGTTEAKNKKDAEAAERELKAKAKADIELHKRTGTGPMTLDIAAGRYMTEVMAGKTSEIDSHRALSRLIKSIGADTRMDAITDGHVSAYIAQRRQETRWGLKKFNDGSTVGRVSDATINREVAVLKRLFFRSRRTWKMPLPNEPDWRAHHMKEQPLECREFTDEQTD